MSPRRQKFAVVFTLAAAALAAAAPALADVPPPGRKQVSYAFQVQNLEAHGEYVLLAYPYTTSTARRAEYLRVEAGKEHRLGPGAKDAAFYAMKRADYDKWTAANPKLESGKDPGADPALAQLFAGDQVSKCEATLTPEFHVDKSDGRKTIVEVLRLASVAPCRLETVSRTPEARGGCGSCVVGGRGEPAPAPAVVAALVALALLRRRSAAR